MDYIYRSARLAVGGVFSPNVDSGTMRLFYMITTLPAWYMYTSLLHKYVYIYTYLYIHTYLSLCFPSTPSSSVCHCSHCIGPIIFLTYSICLHQPRANPPLPPSRSLAAFPSDHLTLFDPLGRRVTDSFSSSGSGGGSCGGSGSGSGSDGSPVVVGLSGGAWEGEWAYELEFASASSASSVASAANARDVVTARAYVPVSTTTLSSSSFLTYRCVPLPCLFAG